jgi:Flp pilus assembly protein TadB
MEALMGFVALLMAVLVGYTTSQFAAIADPSVAGRLRHIDQPAVARDAFAVVGHPFYRILPQAFQRIEVDLYWAAFTSPSWAEVTPAWVVGRQVLAAAALGILTAWILRTPLGLAIGGALGWSLMRADLVTRAGLARKRISQELPEFMQLMAAESASGAGLDTVLVRAAQGVGTLPVWLRRVLAMAHGRSLLPGGGTEAGILLEEAQRSGHPDLISFAIQMGFTRQGTQVKDTLTRLATQFSDTYIGQAEIRTEQLANSLGVLVAVFYFLPFMILILLVVGVPLLKAF